MVMKSPKKNLRKLLLAVAILAIVLYVILFSGITQAGSYPYAQEYKFNVPAKVLFDQVEKFKANNEEYCPPKKYNLIDSFDTVGFSHIYLYYEDQKTLVHLFITGNTSSIYFDGLNDFSDDYRWHRINRDFDRNENLAVKTELRQRFLDKLDLKYKDNGNNALVFWK